MKKIILMLLLIIPTVVNANNIQITNVGLDNKSNGFNELNEPSFTEGNIYLNNTFCELNQSITYKISINNNSESDYQISLQNTLSSEYLDIELDNEIIETGKGKDIFLTIKYLKIPKTVESGETFKEDVYFNAYLNKSINIINPKTGYYNSVYIVLSVILVLLIIGFLYLKKTSILIPFLFITFLLFPFDGAVKADDVEKINIKLSVSYSPRCNADNYSLDTSNVKTSFYKFGTFTTKGLKLLVNNNELNFNPKIIEYPNLHTSGDKDVKIKYGNNEYKYTISVRDNRFGDLITLKDGSRWYYLSGNNDEINLLSVYELKKKSSDSLNLTFLSNNDSIDSVYITKFDDINEDYNNSSVKNSLYNNFNKSYLSNLASITNIDVSKIKIDLPDAQLLNELLESDGTDEYLTGNNYNRYNAMFLKGYKTYWTKTKRNNTAQYTVHQNNGRIGYAINNKNNEYSLRPQMTIPTHLLDKITLNNDLNSDNSLDLVSSLDYIIYDINNHKVIREVKNIDSKYNNSLNEGEYYLGPNTTEYLYPASVTKITTIMYALEKMKVYNIKLDDIVNISNQMKICSDNFYASGGQVIHKYDKVTYRDLIYAALYGSSWDATVQLALSLSNQNGKLDINKDYKLGLITDNLDATKYTDCEKLDSQFAKEMNDFVNKKILDDKKNTKYINVSGNLREGHQTTIYDTALILGYAMKNPDFKNLFTDSKFRDKYTSDNYEDMIINNPSSPIFGLKYFVGGKIGNAKWVSKRIHSGYNWAVYYEKDGQGYVVFTAKAQDNYHMINDQFLIYQWLFI